MFAYGVDIFLYQIKKLHFTHLFDLKKPQMIIKYHQNNSVYILYQPEKK